ncbi:Di-copper centre-containing protein [Xylariaceae sp. FL1019]|nr:Di-copper centre-containing protein [Xylariaceae sp. FL1019]
MRYSIASQALCGAVTVSAMALPNVQVQKRAELVDLSDFQSFETMDPQEILDNANETTKELFSQGVFNDGPMDSLGNFLSDVKGSSKDKSPFGLFEDIQDKLDDKFEEIKDKTQQPSEDASSEVESGTSLVVDDSQKASNAAAAGTCDASNPQIRVEWSSYADSDRTAFVDAIKCLMDKPSGGSQFTGSQSRYEDLASTHRQMTANIHGTALFMVWHRYFTWVFEQLLRDECGLTKAMPWWDETKHAGNFAGSDIFTDAWFGNLPAKTADGQGTCIESGAFAGTTLHVGPGTANSDHCLSRGVDESQTAQASADYTNSCLSQGDYDDFRGCFELGPHGYGHNGIGAVMQEVSSSVGDPIFFMHHSFVDHTFRIWQNADSSRTQTIDGCADTADPCTPISLDTVMSTNDLQPDITVGEALKTLGGTFCYRYDY